MTFQWHITEKCNYRCKHCYQDVYDHDGLDYDQMQNILEQLKDFVIEKGISKAHINFTGGEPFLREDFIDLLRSVKETKLFSIGILSNGFIPSNQAIQELKKIGPQFVQISLEGSRETNDYIRGAGSYNQILNSLKLYRKNGIPTMISFTANSKNFHEYPHVVRVARKYKAFKVWTDRYLPNGLSDELQLSTDQFRLLGEMMLKEKRKSKYMPFSKTIVSTNRALQFLFCGGLPYQCSAGKSLIAILSNGDILPCRRLPIKVGNLLIDNMIDVYNDSQVLNDLRNESELDVQCQNCIYKNSCNGGLKCLSYHRAGDYNLRDVNCWL